ncbi:MAG: TlpA family protein disulfide reductase [Psychroflexus sp.]
MFKKYKLLILSVLVTLVAILLGAISWVVQFIGVGLLFYLFSYLLLKKERNFLKLIILCLPFILVYALGLFLNSIHFNDALHVIPILLVPLLSIALAYFIKSRYIIVTSILIIFLGFIFMENWLNFAFYNSEFNKIDFPTEKAFLKDMKDQPYDFDHRKTYVVDLWNSSCRVCFEKFPEFEELSSQYKAKTDDVEFITLNIPLQRDSAYDIKSYVSEYEFKSIFSQNPDLGRLIGVTKYPTVLIIDQSQTIVYAGSINNKWYHLYNNFDHLIKTHLKK